MSFKWTEENITKMKELKRAGKTHAEIAKKLGATERSVEGKLSRLRSDYQRPRVEKPGRVQAPVLSARDPVRLYDLRAGQCHWPLGNLQEKAEFFCAAPIKEGHPYCPHHVHRSLKVNERGQVHIIK